MKWLGQNKIESWILGFLVVVVALLIFAAVGYLSGRWEALGETEQRQQVELYTTDVPLDTRLLQLDKRALDEAYHQQLLKLWSVWLSEGAKEPKFFQNGLANARRAYNQAAAQISARESVLFEKDQHK